MAFAIAYPVAITGRPEKGSIIEPLKDIHKGTLSNARKVLRLTPLSAKRPQF